MLISRYDCSYASQVVIRRGISSQGIRFVQKKTSLNSDVHQKLLDSSVLLFPSEERFLADCITDLEYRPKDFRAMNF